MSGYAAIADVSETIRTVLLQEMQADPDLLSLFDLDERLSLQSPADLKTDNVARLSLYLYRILEDPHAKNRNPVVSSGTSVRKAPLTLDLFYLLTPLLGQPREQQLALGKAMQSLYDRASLHGDDLLGTLAGGEPIRLILNPVTLEETTRVWQALEMSYRLSVCYIARVALVNSGVEALYQPVISRDAVVGERRAPRKAVMQ
jgi:hypothetical protein